MEETSAVGSNAARGTSAPECDTPRDLREWIDRADAIGQITRVRQRVDRDEMGAITYMAHQTINAPAPLFENIEDCKTGFRALWNLIGSSPDRGSPGFRGWL